MSNQAPNIEAGRSAVRFRALLAVSGLVLSIVILSPEWVRAALAASALAALMIFRIAAMHYGWARRGIIRTVPPQTDVMAAAPKNFGGRGHVTVASFGGSRNQASIPPANSSWNTASSSCSRRTSTRT